MKLEQWVNQQGELIAQQWKLTLWDRCKLLLMRLLGRRNGTPWRHLSYQNLDLMSKRSIGGQERADYSKRFPAKKPAALSKTKIAKSGLESLIFDPDMATRQSPGTSTGSMDGTK